MPDEPMQTKSGSISRHLTPEEEAIQQQIGRATQNAALLLEQNQVQAAEQAAQEAVRLSAARSAKWQPSRTYPTYLDNQLTDVLARIYSRQGRYEQAAELFNFRAEMNLNAAVALVKTGRYAEAKKSYKEVHILTYHPDFKPYMPGSTNAKTLEATIFLGRGIVDYDEWHYGSAAWALAHTVQLIPRNPLALWYYGKALTAIQQNKQGRTYYEAAVRCDKNGPIGAQARMELAQNR